MSKSAQADGLKEKLVYRDTIGKVWLDFQKTFHKTPRMADRLFTVYLGAGVSHLFTPEGFCMVNNFNSLSNCLQFKDPCSLINAIKISKDFICGISDNHYKLCWFASPLFVNKRIFLETLNTLKHEYEEHPENEEKPDAAVFLKWGTIWQSAQSLGPEVGLYKYIIKKTGCNNIILSGGKTQASQRSESAETSKKQTPLLTVDEKREQVHEFFVKLAQVKEFYQPWIGQRLDPVGHGIDEKYQFTMDQTRDILQQLKEVYYKPYFLSQDRFFSMNDEGRRAWFHNMLYMDFSKNRILKRAIADCRRKWKVEDSAAFRKAREESVKSRRASLTPFEWMDEQGNRHYQDAQNGDTLIPADAPGRPNADAFWNEFSHSWEKDNE